MKDKVRAMASRRYGQMCPVARALDVLGERWTLLVVRELLLGPKRFKDLLAALPAMGANRLSARLRTLEEGGAVVRRALAPPSGVAVYELTPAGERLAPVVYCLGAWGAGLPIGKDDDRAGARAELLALGLAGASDPALTAGLEESYDFVVGEEHFHVAVEGGRARALSGPSPRDAAVRVECDFDTFLSLAAGELEPDTAARACGAKIEGDPDALARAFALLDLRDAGRELRLVPA